MYNVTHIITNPFPSAKSNERSWEMEATGEVRRKYCANCGREIEPGKGIVLNYRYTVCSEGCKKDFDKGKLL